MMDQAKIYHDRSVRAANFDVNDQVKVLNTAIDPSITKKFKKKWVGPFLLVSKSGPDYVIKPMSAKGRRRTVNQNKLQRYHPRELILQNSGEYNTPMDIKQEESRHEEQQVVSKRRQRKTRRPKRSSHHQTTAPQLKHPPPISKRIASNAIAQTTLHPQLQPLVMVAFPKPLIASHPAKQV